MSYMIQLDALRAFAVFAVLFQHYYWYKIHTKLYFDWGAKGVDLFFVLSGFLITGILLCDKEKIENREITLLKQAKQFYIRRTLRIFPIYYLTLIITALFAIGPVRETIIWHLTYLSNVYFAMRGEWNGQVTHLWSLAVEEQFYLLWPWLILMMPRKYLLRAMIVVALISPCYRLLCGYLVKGSNLVSYVMTVGTLDLFAIGGVLALLKHERTYENYLGNVNKTCLLIGGPIWLSFIILRSLNINSTFFIFYRTFEGLLYFWIINKASEGMNDIFGQILSFKPLVYIGKISYGIYLFHNFIPTFVQKGFEKFSFAYPQNLYVQLLLNTLTTILVAAVSWKIIEKPINGFKNSITTNTRNCLEN